MEADGAIDRSRLLTATLDALGRDFAPFRAGWFSRLHEALKPSRDERAKLTERYLDLLNSRVPATVSFAVKALVESHKNEGYRAVIALERLAPAFQARDKGTVERALALAAKISRESGPAAEAQVASLAARALGHESPEVQTAALKLVRGDAALIAPYLPLLAPSVRAGLEAAEPGAATMATREASPTVGTTLRVEPIASLNELVEAFAAVVENQGPPVEIERVIDGVARIGISAPADEMKFERLTAGLANRAEKLLGRGGISQPRAALATLALAWTRKCRTAAPESENDVADFLVWRLWCASEQAAQRVEQPLLSLPTSPDGRIEPGEFDLRLAALTDSQRKTAESDSEVAVSPGLSSGSAPRQGRCGPGTHAPCLEEAKLGSRGAKVLLSPAAAGDRRIAEAEPIRPRRAYHGPLWSHTRNEAMVRYRQSALVRGLVCGGLPRSRQQPRVVASRLVYTCLPGATAQYLATPRCDGRAIDRTGTWSERNRRTRSGNRCAHGGDLRLQTRRGHVRARVE
jgi:hypothetical protein